MMMIRLSDEEFDRAVEDALAEIPDEFEPYLDNVLIEVVPKPDAKMLRDHEFHGMLLGLYIGHPLDHRSVEAPPALPDRILIFRDNLRRVCQSRDDLVRQVRVTVLHEIGHHFGMDEDDLEALGYG